ncbi:MAG: glycosyltransferase family 39 protein [Nitrosopumilaceae archaeon]
MNITTNKFTIDNKLFLVIIGLMLTVFIFTNDGHRYTLDEDMAQQQTIRIVTQEPHPMYVQGKSKMLFEYPEMTPHSWAPICLNAIFCSAANIGHSITEAPLVFINHNFHIITKDTVVWTTDDFDDAHYVWWRNNLNPDFTFMELFYGPIISALSVGVFFLICRTFNFRQRNSTMLALLFGFTTILWAYSKTSLNGVPVTFFVLLGFLFFRKFQKNQSPINLIFCGASYGFGFLVRQDAFLFILPLFFFLIYEITQQHSKIKKILAFTLPLIPFYVIYRVIDFIRVGTTAEAGIATSASTVVSIGSGGNPIHEGIFGLLLSPGAGLLIFAPILLTIFFAFPDFYKRNKRECILLLSFAALFLIHYGPNGHWHGFVAWSARYLLPIVPFLLLPLGASLEKRKNLIFKSALLVLVTLGVFFNLAYVVQDVSWFVWTYPGSHTGLFGIALPTDPIYIHPRVLWDFEYSQLTHSILKMIEDLQPDIFMLKLLGLQVFATIFTAILASLSYLLISLTRSKSKLLNSVDSLE